MKKRSGFAKKFIIAYVIFFCSIFLMHLFSFIHAPADNEEEEGHFSKIPTFSDLDNPGVKRNSENVAIRFNDIGGIEEPLEELKEIVEFLKNPDKFAALGGHAPKGILLAGPPGTGKTLIAKAVAGEANCHFYSVSASEFIEQWVGVGASRIRKLFDKAKRKAPSIIFIDEIDAIGQNRSRDINEEHLQTLNQLLTEMDGFDANTGIIVIAATNRPESLDPALTRSGRIDRKVYIPLPDMKGRYDILKIHAKKLTMDDNVNLMKLAQGTSGASGADLANILNESALLAARKDLPAITETEIFEARDKVFFGRERKSLDFDKKEKLATAYHEAGHTIVSHLVKYAEPADKVSITPRGSSLGQTMFIPKKDRVTFWRREIIDELAVLMGGRCAEEVFTGDISSGAQNDLEQATTLVKNMVLKWGMSEKVGLIVQETKKTDPDTDEEIRHILEKAYRRSKKIIEENKDKVELMAQMLVEFETLDSKDIGDIVNNHWNAKEKRERLIAKQGD